MTNIKFEVPLPSQFRSVSYLDATPALFEEYEDSFGDVQEITIKIKIYIQPFSDIKNEPEWSENFNEGIINIPFTQMRDRKGLTKLPDSSEFYKSIKRYLDNAIEDYEEKFQAYQDRNNVE